jgi:hypothetical protein
MGEVGLSPPSKPRPVTWVLFLATGLALPLFAFPVFSISGKAVDLATLFAVLFLFFSAPYLLISSRAEWAFLVAALAVPLLALTMPRSTGFGYRQFAFSYAHWALVVGFFFAALRSRFSEPQRRGLSVALVTLGLITALFALYQAIGISRHWPATGPLLFRFQREPLRLDSGPGYIRPTATFLEPAWLGGFLAWILVLAVSLLLSPNARRWRPALLPVTIAVLLALVATVSWGAYADLVVGFAVGVLTLRVEARSRIRLLAPLGAAVLIGALFLVASQPGRQVLGALRSRLSALIQTPLDKDLPASTLQDTSRVRYQNFLHLRDLFLAHPVRGVGLGQLARHAGPGSVPDWRFSNPWCGWLAIAAQMGVLGPCLLVAAFFLVARRHRSSRDDSLDSAVPALLAVAAVMQLHTGSFIDLWWWYPMSLAAVAAIDDNSRHARVPGGR